VSDEDALRDAHQQLRREARANRRAFATSPEGGIARQLTKAMGDYHRMRTEGVSREDACRGLELVLRDAFQLSKFPPACLECDDSGWREMACWSEQRCGRRLCATAHPAHEHRYVVPCDCSAGDKHRPKRYAPEDEIARVGRMPKRKSGFTRFGHP
jgi:hypothetical protein